MALLWRLWDLYAAFHPPGPLWPGELQGLQKSLQAEMTLNSLLGKAEQAHLKCTHHGCLLGLLNLLRLRLPVSCCMLLAFETVKSRAVSDTNIGTVGRVP